MRGAAVAIVIPSWNGQPLLERFLPSVMDAMRSYEGECECIVVDDGSTDSTEAWLREKYPCVQVVKRKRNAGFSTAANDGIRAARHELVLLLNNDIEVDAAFLKPLVASFENNPQLFAAGSIQRTRNVDGTLRNSGISEIIYQDGHLSFVESTEKFLNGDTHPFLVANGGCTVFSRDKLLQLGLFSELFNPFYGEDTELSIQALKRGWKIRYVPQSVVIHQHGTTSQRKSFLIRFTPMRNGFYIHWLTLDTPRLWESYLLYFCSQFFHSILFLRPRFILGLLFALFHAPALIHERKRRERNRIFSLEDLLKDARADSIS